LYLLHRLLCRPGRDQTKHLPDPLQVRSVLAQAHYTFILLPPPELQTFQPACHIARAQVLQLLER
jgi:hypothetical protein